MTTQNPLHKYNSYSYHHILVACDTVAVAESIATMSSSAVYDNLILHKGAGGLRPGEEGADQHGLVVRSGAGGKYIILINGTSDGEFYIRDAHWNTLIAPSYGTDNPNRNQLTTMATEGAMTIIEPKGFRFLNVLYNAGVKLDVDPLGTAYVLKTIFVGHGNGAPTYISDVKPLLMNIMDLTGTFHEGGAEYQLDFIGLANGLSKSPALSVVGVNTFTVPSEDSTLLNVMSVYANALTTHNRSTIDLNNLDVGNRPITYVIELHEQYLSSDYKVDGIQTQSSGRGVDQGPITFGANTDVEMGITKLMDRCSKIQLNASNTPKEIYKIHSVVESTDTSITITYYICPFHVASRSGTEPLGDHQLLQYDYIYTGKNVDVIEFNMRMAQGLLFFQSLNVTRTATEDQSGVGTKKESRAVAVGSETMKKRSKSSELPPPSTMNMHQLSVKDPKPNHEFHEALSQHASIEQLETRMVIHGNPLILGDLNSLPSEVKAGNSSGSVANKWMSVPLMCKVNISMPRIGSEFALGQADQYTSKFWYDGPYGILQVEHVFRAGMFTQILDMISLKEPEAESDDKEYQESLDPLTPPTGS